MNDVPVDSLTQIIKKMAEKWGEVDFASHKQFFFFVQEKETTQFYPFNQGFNKMIYPETIIFFYGEEKKEVYQTQLASYHTIRQALLWCLRNRIFGDETDTIFHELVSVSSVFRTIQRAKDAGKMIAEGMEITPAFRVDEHYKLR